MAKDIAPRYSPREVEQSIYSKWEQEGFFHAEPSSSKKPFAIVIPPPNITGILHMGHALNNTLQDILIRWKRMQGYASLWMPGTDHAGIATQNVVEKKLAKENKTRDDLGREEFLKQVWKWRDEYGSTIIEQLKRLGASCDWARTRFTMDEGYSKAVVEAFGILWNRKPTGEIYQGEYIINWCPRCRTALSDEEAPRVDVEGKLYYIRYPFSEKRETREETGSLRNLFPPQASEMQGVIVATTRPETMLGDTAVAVNSKDRRYKNLVGESLILPLLNRNIPIIADDFVDKKFGTGAVKVTPAHDPNDFEMGIRHKLELVLVMNPDGTMNDNAGRFKGMDRFAARDAIVKALEEQNLLVKIESHSHAVGHCYRCNTVIEPYLSNQLFVRMRKLAEPAIEAVKSGRIKFYPKRWTKVYLNWMENIRDWCISRQIWWGHRVPLYWCEDCKIGIFFSREKPEKCPRPECGSANIKQHNDVLDTWFSSWLWPFATFQKKKDLDYFYPTAVLVTAPEILFFWVARMIMAGMEFMKDIPFKDVYIHGTVRDLTGKKMSKSLGNIIDPIDIIDEYGADALRYSMIAITATGQDVFLSKEKFELGRNFANKIWNASRFVLMSISAQEKDLTLADKWILSKLNNTIEAVTKSLESYRFNEAEAIIYGFFWHEYCDWYVEMVKPRDKGGNRFLKEPVSSAGKQEARESVLTHVLEMSLKLLHPFMPFVTEAVWQNIMDRQSIMVEKWPQVDKKQIDANIEGNMETIKSIIVGIRNIRSDMDIPFKQKLKVYLVPLKKGEEAKLKGGIDYIKHLAQLEELTIDKKLKKPKHSASTILEGFNVFIPLEAVINIEAEKSRLHKKKLDLEKQLSFTEKKLKDKNFTKKAPEEVVAQEKSKKQRLKDQIKRLKDTLKDL